MATRRQSSLKLHLNQIREWVAEGATDLWIGHQLETTASAVARFRRQQGILRDRAGRKPAAVEDDAAPAVATPAEPSSEAPSDAAPVETSPSEPVAPAEQPKAPRRRRGAKTEATDPAVGPPTSEFETPGVATPATEADSEIDVAATASAEDSSSEDSESGSEEPRSRRRGRRGGRGRRREAGEGEETGSAEHSADVVEVEGVFDHGADGFGLWLDATVRDAGVYRTHWQGKRELLVTVSADKIVLRRS